MRQRTEQKLRRRAAVSGELYVRPSRFEVVQHAFVELVKYTTKITGSDHASMVQKTTAFPRKPEIGVSATAIQAEAQTTKGLSPDGPMAWRSLVRMWYRANTAFRRTCSCKCLYNISEPIAEEKGEPEYIGFVAWSDHESRNRSFIDLIPADKSPIKISNYATGPPQFAY